MKIVYMHHGNRLRGNPPTRDDGLTEIGIQDCELVAKLLNDSRVESVIRAIYTASTFRCKKTVEIINKFINAPIIEDGRLDEMGEGESWVDVQVRVMSCLDEIINKYDENDMVVCITSGVNIVGFINKAYGIEPKEDAPYLGVPTCSPIIFEYKKS